LSEREQEITTVRALIAAEPILINGSTAPLGRPVRLQQLCRAAVRTVPALGAAVTVMTPDGLQPVAVASDPKTQTLEELQFSFGEGPCVEAFADRRPVLESDLGGRRHTRWPAYTAAALEQGVQAVFAFPLQIGAARLGVLDMYRELPGGLSAPTLRRALTFAEVALSILLEGQADAGPEHPVQDLESAVESRSELFQAQGMVMIQLGVSLAESMSRLRAHAYANDRRLGDVARDVVVRRLQFEPDRMSGAPD
jgi:hypothetical protein